jgi:predicted nucleotidyltransferase
MKKLEKEILKRFKVLLLKRLPIYKIVLFGSRARGDATPYSDMDVVVITEKPLDEREIDYVSDCAWEAGFEKGIVVVPVVFSKDEWENSPERYSLLAQAVEMEGIAI